MRKRSNGVSRRELKPMFHVFCEDTKSARYYIDLFRELFCGNTRLIQIEDRSHTDPKGLVGEAIQLKKRVSRSSSFW